MVARKTVKRRKNTVKRRKNTFKRRKNTFKRRTKGGGIFGTGCGKEWEDYQRTGGKGSRSYPRIISAKNTGKIWNKTIYKIKIRIPTHKYKIIGDELRPGIIEEHEYNIDLSFKDMIKLKKELGFTVKLTNIIKGNPKTCKNRWKEINDLFGAIEYMYRLRRGTKNGNYEFSDRARKWWIKAKDALIKFPHEKIE